MSFCHYLDCTSRMGCCLSRTMDRSMSLQHFLRIRQFRVCSSQLRSEFWSVNIARICNYEIWKSKIGSALDWRLCKVKQKTRNYWYWPLVSFKVFQFDSQGVVFVVGQHVNIFISHPEFFGRVTETIFVISPVTIEILSGFAKLVTSLNHLRI